MYQSRRRIVRNSKGYTLIEALFSFTVFILLSHILVFVYSWIQHLNTSFFTNEQVAWELFVQDVQQTLINVEKISLTSDSRTIEVTYQNSEETRKINRSNDTLRLITSNQGNIPLLIGVKNVWFEWSDYILTITVEFQNGLEKERRFFVQTGT
ncbi:MAG TPA: competence type IV pilus minor pilin ComGF [Ureibacillus sp.]|nr:competence type IV pilus minor pilin ComGF [Ureibacillus sp.]